MTKTALRLLNDLVKIIYADDYDKLDIPMLRVNLNSIDMRFDELRDKSMDKVFTSAYKRLDERQEADRLKPEELTELMLSKLTVTELNDIMSDIVVKGSETKSEAEKERLRGTYKKIMDELKRRKNDNQLG